MRASRLLHMLLLLQNRGRMTANTLAQELEVARRTVLRDIDALSEAGLPIVVIRGNQGGVELGFSYRTRLTGLADDEAEALTILLSQSRRVLDQLGIRDAGNRAVAKLVESFPDRTRATVDATRRRFVFLDSDNVIHDKRIAAMVIAIRERRIVTLRSTQRDAARIHPQQLCHTSDGWSVVDARNPGSFTFMRDWGDINLSARQFQ